MATTPEIDAWLARFVRDHGGVAGSVHHLRDGALHITGAYRLPEPVVRVTAVIPRGKGMAGLAWERDEAVQTCNLQADTSGDVKPGAKAVNAQGAVAFPVHDSNGAVRAIVGIAYADERVLGVTDLDALRVAASSLP
jgi:hypothetical protein